MRSSPNNESGKNQVDCRGEKDGRDDEGGYLCQECRLVVWAFCIPRPACPAYAFHQRPNEQAVACPASVFEASEELHAECSSKEDAVNDAGCECGDVAICRRYARNIGMAVGEKLSGRVGCFHLELSQNACLDWRFEEQ